VNDLAAALGADDLGGMEPLTPVARFGGGGYSGHGGGGGGGGGGDFPTGPYGGGRTPDVPAVLINDLPPFYPRRRALGRPILTLMALVAIGVGVWLYLDDIARRHAVAWFDDAYHALRRTGGENTVAKQKAREPGSPDSRPTSNATPPRPKSEVPRPVEARVPPPASEATAPPNPATREVTAGAAGATRPASVPVPSTEAVAATAAPTEFPFTAPDGQPETPLPPAALPEPDIESLRQQAKRVYVQALDAQRDRNYPEALRLYEQVRSTFPPEAWPNDLQLRLQLMRNQVK
jgi:hypothetical protein